MSRKRNSDNAGFPRFSCNYGRINNLAAESSGIGKAVRSARRAANLSQVELAAKAGVNPATISTLENGHHTPTATTVEEIARALGISVKALEAMARELAPAKGVAERGRAYLAAPAPRIPPRAYQLIYERVQLMEKAGVPEQTVDELRRLMTDEAFNTMNFRTTEPKTEQGWIDDINAAWAFIRDVLGKRGFKL
jgi:transcriptional regulator with XRE-family HTH domain